jgi:hypothetical protein
MFIAMSLTLGLSSLKSEYLVVLLALCGPAGTAVPEAFVGATSLGCYR